MANQEHRTLLEQGPTIWNTWRREHPEIRPDLSEADLRGATLIGANLSEADLSKATLIGANLIGTNLSEADLSRANLFGADLSRANLSGADLFGADLFGANLSEANLSEANLSEANLLRADLSKANLSGARLHSTRFASNNLTTVKGLDIIIHKGPSIIDFDTTIFPSPGPTLSTFLRGTGSSPYLIEALNGTLLPCEPVPVKVFISYAHQDEELCEQLQAHLSLLIRESIISVTPEAVTAPEISTPHTALREAQFLLLLISASLFASRHVVWKEIIEPALHRQQEGTLRLIPVLLRSTRWQENELGRLSPLPTDGKPVNEWDNLDKALTDVANGIYAAVQPLHVQLQEHAKKQRERDLLTAKIILNTIKTAEKQDQAKEQGRSVEAQKALVQQAQIAYKEAHANLTKAQQQADALQQQAKTLQADLASLTSEHNTLHDQIDVLNTQIQEETLTPLKTSSPPGAGPL